MDFRSGYSCETQLLTTVHDFVTSFEDNKQKEVAILEGLWHCTP